MFPSPGSPFACAFKLIAFTLTDFTLVASTAGDWPLDFPLRRRDYHARAIAALRVAAACGCCAKKPTIDAGFGGGSDGAGRVRTTSGDERRTWPLPGRAITSQPQAFSSRGAPACHLIKNKNKTRLRITYSVHPTLHSCHSSSTTRTGSHTPSAPRFTVRQCTHTHTHRRGRFAALPVSGN